MSAYRFTERQIEDAFQYLDDLRASGDTNMFGAAPYLARDQFYKINAARAMLSLWMDSDRTKTMDERVKKARLKLDARSA